MMPYQSYQIYQAERPKSAAEIRRADEQLGHMAENVSWLWQHAIRRITLFRGQDRQPASSALLDATR
jgi:primase-polymerase (primpol)-like protein